MNNLTKKFLRLCKKAGYRRVAIGVRDNRIRMCRTWQFGFEGSVFASPDRDGPDGWPAIWRITEACGVIDGCANGQQVQIKDNMLDPGKYDLKD